jgi:HSP20 family protein
VWPEGRWKGLPGDRNLNHAAKLAGRPGLARKERNMLTFCRNPEKTMAAFGEEMSRLVDGMVGNGWSYGLAPTADVVETDAEYRVLVDLPGIDPTAIQLRVEKDTLTIRADRKQPAAAGEKVYRSERSFGTFFRSFALPRTVDAERVEAAYEQGVLTVKLPKRAEARARSIAVDVK